VVTHRATSNQQSATKQDSGYYTLLQTDSGYKEKRAEFPLWGPPPTWHGLHLPTTSLKGFSSSFSSSKVFFRVGKDPERIKKSRKVFETGVMALRAGPNGIKPEIRRRAEVDPKHPLPGLFGTFQPLSTLRNRGAGYQHVTKLP